MERFFGSMSCFLRSTKVAVRSRLEHGSTCSTTSEQTIDRFSVTDKKRHDSKHFETGSWLEGRLAILDLAYFKYRRFALIDENDGYFMSRLKRSSNPVVTDEFWEWRGRAILLERKKIFDVVDDLCRKYIDVEVEIEFDRSLTGERERESTRARTHVIRKRFCVVAVRNEDADDYHLYITNLSREEFLLEDLATIYRCRWEVELLFRDLKTQYRLDEFDMTKKHVVEILLYAALLPLVVSRELFSLVMEHADDALVFPPERWAATVRSHGQLILYRLSGYLGYSPPPLLDRVIADAQKIHKQRPVLQEQPATAIKPAAEA